MAKKPPQNNSIYHQVGEVVVVFVCKTTAHFIVVSKGKGEGSDFIFLLPKHTYNAVTLVHNSQ